MTDLTQRYRGPSTTQRVVAAVAVAALALSGVGLVAWSAFSASTPEAVSRLIGYTIVDDHEVLADIAVARETAETDATCRIRAFAEDHAVVADELVQVGAGPLEQSLRVRLRTERRATGIELVGCSTPDQPRPR